MKMRQTLPQSNIYEHNSSRRTLFWLALFGVIGSFFIYGYFVQSTISFVVARKQVESEIGSLNSHTSDLEVRYSTLKENFTREYARTLGFNEAKDVHYVERAQLVKN